MTDDLNIDMSETLSANYMLASLTVRSWSGKVTDANATRELLVQKHALSDAAKVVKSLLAGNDRELRDTKAAFARIRTWFYANSLPWATGTEAQRGDRLVGTVQAMTFLKDFAGLKAQADAALNDFLTVYDQAVTNAATALGELYNPAQYPTADQVRHMFGTTLEIAPMPAVTDFDRVSIPGALAHGLKNLYEKKAERHVESAVADCQERLLAELDRMATQLGKIAAGEKARLYKSLTGNMRTVVQLARAMGPLDSTMAKLADRIENELLTHEVDAYKDNVSLARKVSEAAVSIASEIRPETPSPIEMSPMPVSEPREFEADFDAVFNGGL